MLRIVFADLHPNTDVLAGAALGQKHASEIWATASNQPARNDVILLLDFRGISAVTPSYLKQTLLRLCQCGDTEPSGPRLFPLYTNLSTSTEDDLHHFLLANQLPGIVVRCKGNRAIFEKRIGWLEAAASDTLSRLTYISGGSAREVMATEGANGIALTAWNNRLAELLRLRLATRVRNGRYWIYKPIVEVKNNG